MRRCFDQARPGLSPSSPRWHGGPGGPRLGPAESQRPAEPGELESGLTGYSMAAGQSETAATVTVTVTQRPASEWAAGAGSRGRCHESPWAR